MASVHYFYILKCSDGSFYVGSTTNLKNRVKKHDQGEGAAHTAQRRPVKLVYHEEHKSLDDAVKRERQVKKWLKVKKRGFN